MTNKLFQISTDGVSIFLNDKKLKFIDNNCRWFYADSYFMLKFETMDGNMSQNINERNFYKRLVKENSEYLQYFVPILDYQKIDHWLLEDNDLDDPEEDFRYISCVVEPRIKFKSTHGSNDKKRQELIRKILREYPEIEGDIYEYKNWGITNKNELLIFDYGFQSD